MARGAVTLSVYVTILLNILQTQSFTRGVLSFWIGFPWSMHAVFCAGWTCKSLDLRWTPAAWDQIPSAAHQASREQELLGGVEKGMRSAETGGCWHGSCAFIVDVCLDCGTGVECRKWTGGRRRSSSCDTFVSRKSSSIPVCGLVDWPAWVCVCRQKCIDAGLYTFARTTFAGLGDEHSRTSD